jgi:hypothetical protein
VSDPRELVIVILDLLGLDSRDLPADDDSDDQSLLVSFVKRVRAQLKRRSVWLFDAVESS